MLVPGKVGDESEPRGAMLAYEQRHGECFTAAHGECFTDLYLSRAAAVEQVVSTQDVLQACETLFFSFFFGMDDGVPQEKFKKSS